jgi:hypothetical protein
LIAANELSLQELFPYLEAFLIKRKADWLEQNFDLIYRTSFENNSFLQLQKYCTDLITKEPNKIFNSPNFSLIPESLLISLIQNRNVQFNEAQVWEHVIKWGLAQNPELSSNIESYSKDDFNTLKNTLRKCIPLIKFHNLTSKEFSEKVLPYKKLFPKELYKSLLKDFLNNDSKPIKPNIKSESEPALESLQQIITGLKNLPTVPPKSQKSEKQAVEDKQTKKYRPNKKSEYEPLGFIQQTISLRNLSTVHSKSQKSEKRDVEEKQTEPASKHRPNVKSETEPLGFIQQTTSLRNLSTVHSKSQKSEKRDVEEKQNEPASKHRPNEKSEPEPLESLQQIIASLKNLPAVPSKSQRSEKRDVEEKQTKPASKHRPNEKSEPEPLESLQQIIASLKNLPVIPPKSQKSEKKRTEPASKHRPNEKSI